MDEIDKESADYIAGWNDALDAMHEHLQELRARTEMADFDEEIADLLDEGGS